MKLSINERIFNYLQITPTTFGYKTSLESTIRLMLILSSQQVEQAGIDSLNVLKLKLTLDGRPMGGKEQVLVGIIPLNTSLVVQSWKSTFPLLLFNATETIDNIQTECQSLIKELDVIRKSGIVYNSKQVQVNIFMSTDLALLWKITNLR